MLIQASGQIRRSTAMSLWWSRVLRISALLFGAVLFAAACGQEFPSEEDVPEEAFIAMPGAAMTGSGFTEGDEGSYIDGGGFYYPPTQGVGYSADGVTGRKVFDWYAAEMSSRGWEDTEPQGDLGGGQNGCKHNYQCGEFVFDDQDAGLHYGMSLHIYLSVSVDGSKGGRAGMDEEIAAYSIRTAVLYLD